MMKNFKKLLVASALVAGVSTSAIADGAAVKVGGLVNFRASFFNQTAGFETASSKFDKSNRFNTTTRISVAAENTADFGLKYGTSIWLDDDTTNSSGTTPRIRGTSLYMTSGLGKVEMGTIDAPTRTMKIDATKVTRGDSGIDTFATTNSFMNSTIGYIDTSSSSRATARFITAPALPLDHGSVMFGRYNKISYYTPDMGGLQFGASYGSDTQETGGLGNMQSDVQTLAASPNQYANLYYDNAFSLAATYKQQMDQMSFAVGATAQVATSKKVTNIPADHQRIKDVKAYSFGGQVTYTNYSLAASYGNWNKSTNNDEATNILQTAAARYYTVGGSYVQGPVGLSVSFLDSSRQKNKFQVVSVGADYQLAPGLMPYVEGNFFRFKPYTTGSVIVYNATTGSTAASKNKGNVVYVGTKLSF